MLRVQVADFLFGTAALPHDFLHEPLLRILATGFAGASTAAAGLNVSHLAIETFAVDLCNKYFWSVVRCKSDTALNLLLSCSWLPREGNWETAPSRG